MVYHHSKSREGAAGENLVELLWHFMMFISRAISWEAAKTLRWSPSTVDEDSWINHVLNQGTQIPNLPT